MKVKVKDLPLDGITKEAKTAVVIEATIGNITLQIDGVEYTIDTPKTWSMLPKERSIISICKEDYNQGKHSRLILLKSNPKVSLTVELDEDLYKDLLNTTGNVSEYVARAIRQRLY